MCGTPGIGLAHRMREPTGRGRDTTDTATIRGIGADLIKRIGGGLVFEDCFGQRKTERSRINFRLPDPLDTIRSPLFMLNDKRVAIDRKRKRLTRLPTGDRFKTIRCVCASWLLRPVVCTPSRSRIASPQCVSARDINQTFPVSSTSTIANRPPPADQPPRR